MDTSTKTTAYEAPELRAHGSLEDLTQGAHGNYAVDAAFPAHTPLSQLTFS